MEAAGEAVEAAVREPLEALLGRAAGRDAPRAQPCVVHDAANNAVWLHVLKGSHVRAAATVLPAAQ